MPCDYSKYPKDWKRIRERILERDRYRCQVCGVMNYALVFRGYWKEQEVFQDKDGKIYRADNGLFLAKDLFAAIEPLSGNEDQKSIKIILTVAHLNHDISDNRDENLAALCQLHHLRLDSKKHKKNARQTREKKMKLQRLFK